MEELTKGPVDVVTTLINANKILKFIGAEPQPMMMNEEIILDVIVDLFKKSGLLTGEEFKEIGLYDGNEFTLETASGQSFTISIKEDTAIYPWDCASCRGIQPHNIPQTEFDWECQSCASLHSCDTCGNVIQEEDYQDNGGYCHSCQEEYLERIGD